MDNPVDENSPAQAITGLSPNMPVTPVIPNTPSGPRDDEDYDDGGKSSFFYVAIGFIIILLLSVGAYAFYAIQIKEDSGDTKNSTDGQESTLVKPSDQEEFSGILPGTVNGSETKAKETSTSAPIGLHEEPEEEIQIDLTGPKVTEKAESVVYLYKITLNDSALKELKNGFKYKISQSLCKNKEVFVGSDNFSDEINSPKLVNDFSVEIKEFALDLKTDLAQADYSITTLQGKLVREGKTEIPKCNDVTEVPANGEFSISEPEVDKDLVDGKVHFEWDFDFDDKALHELEKGFKHKIDPGSCDAYSDGFEETWSAGVMESIGFAVNIDDADLPDDESDWLEKSTYEIFDKDGDKIFSGSVQIPNCE